MSTNHPPAHSPETPSPTPATAWKAVVALYQRPALGRSAWQIVNSLGSYILLWVAMYFAASVSIWLALPLAVLAAGFLVRIFIIFHDCGHGSYFTSKRVNDIVGMVTGVLTFTPYRHWRWEHARHHATSGDLDRRGVGDVWTMTVREYLEASPGRRLRYRIARNPVVLFALAPLLLFLVKERIPSRDAGPRERRSVHGTTLAIVVLAAALAFIFGWRDYLILQLTMLTVSGAAGVWLFYVQHQFEGVYWKRGDDWDFATAALQGSSFYRLPRVLQWFSGNIGFHHIHHLSPRIPNYHLEHCHHSDPLFQSVPPVTLWSSLRSLTFRLWDEDEGRLVGFSRLRTHGRRPPSPAPHD